MVSDVCGSRVWWVGDVGGVWCSPLLLTFYVGMDADMSARQHEHS